VRLFVAVNLPEGLRSALWIASQPLRAAGFPVRWVQPDGLHLTLKFLGEVAASREEGLVTAVRSAVDGAKPFSVAIAGVGAFPSAARPRVLWIGCEAAPPLELLQDRVERAFAKIGFPVEGRPFHPHLTLGRARRGAHPRDFVGLDRAAADLSVEGELLVSSVDLMESVLHPSGARYIQRHVAELAG
jgi:2'-5' RNA ligase